MVSINLIGRLTRDPELKRVPNGSAGEALDVCEVRVAARDRRGNSVYLDLCEWGPAGRAAAERLTKGSLIAFTGELRFREHEGDSGTRQYVSAVGHIEFVDSRARAESPAAGLRPETEDIPF